MRHQTWITSFAAGLALGAALCVARPAAAADRIHTGGETGAYHTRFCPALAAYLGGIGHPQTCRPSDGTIENLSRIAARASDLAYGQLDVLALSASRTKGVKPFQIVRSDDVRECIFAVTKSDRLETFGDIAVGADKLKFILPPEGSGSAGTFQFLRSIDPEGLGRAKYITYAPDVDSAISSALGTTDAVALFVQFPDPYNERFRLINRLGGHIVPVIDRIILGQQIDGQRIYFPQETQIEVQRWLRAPQSVVTACTPLAIFTGARRDGASADPNQEAVIKAIRTARSHELLPDDSVLTRVLKRSRELSSSSVERMMSLSEEARARARPALEKAREVGGRVIEELRQKAKPDN